MRKGEESTVRKRDHQKLLLKTRGRNVLGFDESMSILLTSDGELVEAEGEGERRGEESDSG